MNSSQTVSLIVTVFNKEDYIEQCLGSILNSSMWPKTIIIIDDGSTDLSSQVVSTFKDRFPSLLLVSHENQGISYCRNEGISLVDSDYFVFLDADDFIDPHMIERLDHAVQIKEFDIVSFNYDKITKEHYPIPHQHKPKSTFQDGPHVLSDFIRSKTTFDSVWSYLFRTEYFRINGYQFANGFMHEDFGLIPWVILKASRVLCLDDALYFNVMSDNSIIRTSNYAKEVKKANDVLHHVMNRRMDLDKSQFDEAITSLYKTYLVHTLISKLDQLNRKDQSLFIKKLRQQKLLSGLSHKGWRKKIKNLVILISPKFYLRITQR